MKTFDVIYTITAYLGAVLLWSGDTIVKIRPIRATTSWYFRGGQNDCSLLCYLTTRVAESDS